MHSLPGTIRLHGLLLAAVLGAGCGDASPTELTSADLPRVETVTEWAESEPNPRQRGHFHYDAGHRLIRYEFGHVEEDGSTLVTQRIEYSWGDAGRIREWVREVRREDGSFLPTEVQRYRWGPQSLVLETEHRNERTGRIDTTTVTAELDGTGRIVRLATPDTEIRYQWEGGDLLAVLSDPSDGPAQRLELTHGDALNPLAFLPPRPGISLVHYPDLHSRRALSAVENRVLGAPPSYTGTVIDEERTAAGVLARRTLELHNTSLPDDVRTRIVTEFAFREGS